MQKKSPISGSISSRALVVLFVCAGIGFILTRTSPAFLRTEAPANVSQRTLTFAERVAYQRIIEDVYWRHRIWPKERSDPKPSLDAVTSQTQLEKKVTDYLRKSQALEDYWHRPITAEQLQAEMDRMAQHTRQPDVLHELFEALGNDPFVIAECLAKPLLTERLVHDLFESREIKELPVESMAVMLPREGYNIPTISEGNPPCTDNTWAPTTLVDAPTARAFHTAVWTGSEMIVWGGDGPGAPLNTGGRYDPATDNWTATITTNAPSARYSHTAVWTGSEMIVWGGAGNCTGGVCNTGGLYNPITNSWTATSTANAPSARLVHTAVWTGSEMIIWGGTDFINAFNTGGRYDPITDTWNPTSTASAPAQRYQHTAVWTGNEMIVWGGTDNGVSSFFNSGGRYNPGTDSWTDTTTTNAPSGRDEHTAVWTDNEMIVWAGYRLPGGPVNTGGRYNPITNSWTTTSTTNAPSVRFSHTAVWTGSEMIVWGGCCYFNTGGRYNPTINSWIATSTTNVPDARYSPTSVWTGIQMIIWGGTDDAQKFNTGGRYCAQSGPPPTPTPTPTPCTGRCSPTPRPRPTPVARPSP